MGGGGGGDLNGFNLIFFITGCVHSRLFQTFFQNSFSRLKVTK